MVRASFRCACALPALRTSWLAAEPLQRAHLPKHARPLTRMSFCAEALKVQTPYMVNDHVHMNKDVHMRRYDAAKPIAWKSACGTERVTRTNSACHAQQPICPLQMICIFVCSNSSSPGTWRAQGVSFFSAVQLARHLLVSRRLCDSFSTAAIV